MPYLHLPFQAGSDRILAAMNRKHTAEDYEALIGRVRDGAAGHRALDRHHRGLSRRDVTRTSRRRWRSLAAPASPRPSLLSIARAPAREPRRFDGQVPEAVKRERLHALQSLLDQDRHAFDRATVGRKLKVLFEGRGRKPGQIAGRSPYLQAVHAEGPRSLIGEIVEVDILAAGPNSLHGVINLGFAWREPVQAAV